MLPQIFVTIPAQEKKTYPISIDFGIFNNWQQWLKGHLKSRKLVILTDKKLLTPYVKQFKEQLIAAKVDFIIISINGGESSKNQATKEMVEVKMLRSHIDRDALLLIIGGGVIGDLGGFIAATYMRGINYIQVPTTLLSMVDSSVGGKTAINTDYGKNLIGAFWQPQAVTIDTKFLSTLPKKHLINGLIEAIKIFITCEKTSYDFVVKNLNKILKNDNESLQFIIQRAISLKAQIVSQDEREENLRKYLNFGHTIGHALEKYYDFNILHGNAVALGIIVESKIAQLMGFLSQDAFLSIVNLLHKLEVDSKTLQEIDVAKIIQYCLNDKKTKADKIYMIIIRQIGEVQTKENSVVLEVKPKIIKQAFKHLFN
jgi:3-dehydroquinate synthase